MKREIPFWLDFVSPYTWLALMRARAFEHEHSVHFAPRPIVYAKVLEAHGLLGPVETPAKRRYTMYDVARSARLVGLQLVGPPEHPFRSLAALRVATLFGDERGVLDLCIALADSAWSRGFDLTSFAVLAEVVSEVGLDAQDLEARADAAEVKEALRRRTAEAVDLGIFGVPSFLHDGQLFWGHDRMDQLGESLSGRLDPSARADAEKVLGHRAGVVRTRPPGDPSRFG